MVKRGFQRKSTGFTTGMSSDAKDVITHRLSDEQLRVQEKQTSTEKKRLLNSYNFCLTSTTQNKGQLAGESH